MHSRRMLYPLLGVCKCVYQSNAAHMLDRTLCPASWHTVDSSLLLQDEDNLREALRYSAALLGELRTSLLTPQPYYELYMQSTGELQLLEVSCCGGFLPLRDCKLQGATQRVAGTGLKSSSLCPGASCATADRGLRRL